MTDEWRNLVARLQPWSRLSFLGCWATEQGIAPHNLSDAHSLAFWSWLQDWKTYDYARLTYVTAIKSWNKAAAGPNWPGRPIAIEPNRVKHYSVPSGQWSGEFMLDLESCLRVFTNPDVDLDLGHEPVAAETSYRLRCSLLRFASAYVRGAKLDPGELKSIRELFDPRAAKIAYDYILEWKRKGDPEAVKSVDLYCIARHVANAAGRHVSRGVPAEWVETLRLMARNRCPVSHGMSPKNRATLRLFEDEAFLDRFLELPYTTLARIEKKTAPRRVDAVQIMLALAMAQQIEAPLRAGNQERLQIGQNIRLVHKAGRKSIGIEVEFKEVKNKSDLDFELTGRIVPLYEAYIERYRPKLLTDPKNTYLYPGEGLNHKFPLYLSRQVADFVLEHLGERLTAHQFRHVIGYLYLLDHPGEYEVVRQMLGHSSIVTTMTFYAALDIRTASRKVSAFIEAKRSELKVRRRRKRSG